jgi:hypothetical protein
MVRAANGVKAATPSTPRTGFADIPAAETFPIGDDLAIVWVDIAALKEQEINAQTMLPRHFDRLAENIRTRGGVESLPYCHRATPEGPMEIISGHHRARAARAAGLDRIPVILDTRPMRRSEVVAKQIAHNELSGTPDTEILAQLVAMIDNVDDLLATGLDESMLPTVDPDDTTLDLPRAEFDWRMVPLMFLPSQLDDFKHALDSVDSAAVLLGYGGTVEDFTKFARAVHAYGRSIDVRNLSTTVAVLTRLAAEELADRAAVLAEDPEARPVPIADVLPRMLSGAEATDIATLAEQLDTTPIGAVLYAVRLQLPHVGEATGKTLTLVAAEDDL